MAGPRFRSYDEFKTEILKTRSGPLVSPVEDIADEMYHQEFVEEADSLWDSIDDDE